MSSTSGKATADANESAGVRTNASSSVNANSTVNANANATAVANATSTVNANVNVNATATATAVAIAEKRRAFRALHERGCFVIPNPWDVGSALALERLGFRALASTSAGFAYARGRADAAVPRDEVLAHLRELAAAVSIPLNADFQDGFGATASEVGASVRLCVDTGVAGLSIEDATGDSAVPLYPLDVALERLRAARTATPAEVVLTARSEGFIVGRPDAAETLRRLRAYAEAGADCLYAPGFPRDRLAELVAAVAPRPVNVLVSSPGPTVDELAALGVRRVSLGSALSRVAWGAFLRAARELAGRGSFEGLAGAEPYPDMNALFRAG